MPPWAYEMLTPAQASEVNSPIWRWRKLIGASDLPGPVKSVALWISEHCSSSRLTCYPSTATLASESGFSSKTVHRAIAVLEERGFLYVWREDYSEKDKRKKVNHYGPSWPEIYKPTAGKTICGELGRRGEPCQLAAGWGVEADSGPCKYHLDTPHRRGIGERGSSEQMLDRESVRRDTQSDICGTESPTSPEMLDRESHEGTSSLEGISSLKEQWDDAARAASGHVSSSSSDYAHGAEELAAFLSERSKDALEGDWDEFLSEERDVYEREGVA